MDYQPGQGPLAVEPQGGCPAQGHGVLGPSVVCNASLLAWLLGEAVSPCKWWLEPIRLAFFRELSQELSWARSWAEASKGERLICSPPSLPLSPLCFVKVMHLLWEITPATHKWWMKWESPARCTGVMCWLLGCLLCYIQQTGCKESSARSWTKGEDNQLKNSLGSIMAWNLIPVGLVGLPPQAKSILQVGFSEVSGQHAEVLGS